jgi:hypothetical protein
MTYNKTSLLIPYQLPEFIRDNPDYDKFVLFLQAYYEWMEEAGNVTDRSKNILNYIDIDATSQEFLDYYYNDFLSYFPKDILADKNLVTKIAKELYKSKGTQASYKFLFRILYNSDVEFFYTKDAVLRASSGKWYVSKSLKLKSNDPNFLATNNYRIFGEDTKSIAIIENSVFSKNKTEIFISNIERLFLSGEFVRVVDNNNQTLYFKDGQVVPSTTVGATILRAKILGQISQININPSFRGERYITGDPVVVYGGLDEGVDSIGATADVGETTLGSIKRITTDSGGYGYPYNSTVYDSRTGNVSTSVAETDINITGAPGAYAIVGSINPAPEVTSNVTFVSTDFIGLKSSIRINASDYNFQSYVTNVNSSIGNTLNFISFAAYPISSVIVQNQGGGVLNPSVTASASYSTFAGASFADLKYLGILAPIEILDGGTGYRANDTILISGGSGYGAFANVTSVNPTTNAITSVAYVYPSPSAPNKFPLGGMGYRRDSLPALSVSSANVSASNASLRVTGILGDGARFTPITDRAGSITTINIINYGEDYVSAPNVSIRVQDIIVNNVDVDNAPRKGDIVYQGSSFLNSSFSAIVDSLTLVSGSEISELSKYTLRVYNYTSVANNALGPLIVDARSANMYMDNTYVPAQPDARYNQDTGVLVYGDGTAKATAKFLNGLVIGEGQYLDSTGQLSSYSLLQSVNYNDFTYEITVEKEIEKYRKILLDLLHPTGLKVLGRYSVKSANNYNLQLQCGTKSSQTLGFYTGNEGSSAAIVGDFTNQSNNIIQFDGLSGANVEGFIFPNESFISISNSSSQLVYSKVVDVTPEYTNLLSFSQDFQRWTSISTGFVSNAITAPDGSTSADKIVELAATTTHTIRLSVTAASTIGETYTYSVHAKLAEWTSFSIQIGSSGPLGTFNLVTQNATTSLGATAASISSVGDGWFRCSVTGIGNGSANYWIYKTGSVYAGDGVSGVYLWGAQLVTGTVARDYIPSTTTFTSRANTGTYFAANGTLQTAAINIPRYQYNPANLSAPPFLLLETAANNLVTYSEDFRNTAEAGSTRPWTQFNDGASDNVAVNLVSTVNPTGAISLVSKLTQNSIVNVQRQVTQGISAIANNNIYTFSVFAKAQEVKNIRFIASTREPLFPSVTMNLISGNTSSASANILSYGTANCGNGWFRCWVTANVFSGISAAGTTIVLSNGVGAGNYLGSVGDGVLLWGAQAELGYTPTSYISTNTVPVVRATDVATSNSATKYATATLQDNVWVTFANVASVIGVSGNNRLNISYLTGSYDIINNGEYSNTSYPLYDVVRSGDRILVANNTVRTVSSVDPVNNIIVLTSNLTSNANSFMTVNRNIYETDGRVRIYGPLGIQYIPELITEDGFNITTEDDSIILIG